MTEIFKIKSSIPYTEYAPQWDISLGIAQWHETDKIDTIKQFCLDIEEEILSLPSENDGGTGLKNRTTNKFESYNLFDYTDRCPELNDLLNFFKESVIDFLRKDNNPPRETMIKSWFNILKKGDEINEHAHGCKSVDYLSGNMHLDTYKTKTFYKWPYDKVESGVPNHKGNLTIFPSYMFHRANKHLEETPRVSIAFDLYVKDFMSEDLFSKSIPFITLDNLEEMLYYSN